MLAPTCHLTPALAAAYPFVSPDEEALGTEKLFADINRETDDVLMISWYSTGKVVAHPHGNHVLVATGVTSQEFIEYARANKGIVLRPCGHAP